MGCTKARHKTGTMVWAREHVVGGSAQRRKRKEKKGKKEAHKTVRSNIKNDIFTFSLQQ